MIQDMLRSLKHEAIRLCFYAAILCIFLPLLLVPLLGHLAFSAIMTYVSIRYLTWDGLDYAMSRRRFRFRQKMDFLRARRLRTLGYGSISFLLLCIPLTTLFVLPLNAIGGTMLFCRIVDGEGLDL